MRARASRAARAPRWCLARRAWPVAALLLVAVAARAQHWTIADPGQGPVALAPGAAGARELSGLAWAGDERFYAVSDNHGGLFRLRIALDPASGAIRAAAVEEHLRLPASTDLEGLAMGADGSSVFVTDEVGPALREHRLADGAVLRRAAVPPPFTALRRNFGFESLARDAHGALWTANEDALRVDGPTSGRDAGALVRLQRFDAALRSDGQWAYALDPVGGPLLVPGHGSGLSELVALPDGRLLALERALSTAGLRIRIYEIDVRGGADVSRHASLADAAIEPLRKHLLWERQAPRENFEGAALGPPLADGSRSLLLISDDGHANAQALYALRVAARAAP